MKIRSAHISDLEQITKILNQSIGWGKATAIREPLNAAQRVGWFNEHKTGIYEIFVAEDENKIVGYLSVGHYRKERQAFRHTAEVSYFVDFEHHRKGIANQLLEKAYQHCRKHSIKNLLAFLMEHNEASVKLMRKAGFELWGVFPKTLIIDGLEYDHLIFGKRLTK